MEKTTRFNLLYLVLAVLGAMVIHDLWGAYRTIEQVPYSEFQKLLRDGKVRDIVISSGEIQGSFKEAQPGGKTRFVTTRVEEKLAEDLDKFGVTYSGQVENSMFLTVLSWVGPVALFFVVWMFLMRRMAGRGGPANVLAIGKSKARVYVESETGVAFKDVAGVDEAKGELEEIVSFLKDPKSYGRLGARMPKGVLLVGPPGTGKTLLARAVAGEAKVPFFSISGSEFVEMFVGVGAARVRDLFEQARQKAPCIIFIDELDALGRARSAGAPMGGNDEKEQTLNQLLVELDGFDSSSGIVLLGATNRPEILDPALLRAGRFDRQVLVGRPDRRGRADILRVHVKKITLEPEVALDEIAAMTPGFTGADLATLANEAALVATRRSASAVALSDFTAAVERLIAGLEKKSQLIPPRERRIVAHHEMGHALVASALNAGDPVQKVSIVPRGIGALGYTLQRPGEDRYLMTREELESKMAVLLGGRAAEKVVFGHFSTGAADDLSKATAIARDMVSRYAMVPELGNATWEEEPTSFLGAGVSRRTHSEETAHEIDGAVRRLVDEAFARARGLLEQNRALLEESAAKLLEKETLEQAELAEFFARVQRDGAAPTSLTGTA